jgi:DNA repair exonuclease SbcCD ATPase subunit
MTAALRFHSLKLRNYKAYRGDHTVSLDRAPGVYLLRGDNKLNPSLDSNGAGKSSLADAITWCFYGKTLRDEKPGASVEPWTGEKPVAVSVTFSVHGKKYSVTRGRKPNSLHIDLREATQEQVDKLVGLSYTAFLCTVILPQFGERFLDLSAEQQARLFSETLDLDLWLRAADTAGKLARDADKEADDARLQVATQEGALAELVDQQAREEKRAADFDAEAAQRDVILRVDIAAAYEELYCAEEALKTAGLGVPTEAELRAGEDTIAHLEADIERLATEHADYLRMFDSIESEMDRLEAEIAKLKERPEQCPTCGHKVKPGHFDKEIAKLETEHFNTNEERDVTKATIKDMDDDLERMRQQVRDKRTSVQMGRDKVRDAARDLAKKEKDVADWKATITAFERCVGKAEVNPFRASMAEVSGRIEVTLAELETSDAARAEAEYSAQCYKFWAEGYRTIRLNQIDDLLRSLEEAVNNNAAELGLSGWRMEFATEKETSTGKVSRSFQTLLYPPGHTKPVRWESFCGVEVQIWQLAVRFALAELLLAHAGVEPNIEILDEPTQHLSPGVIDALLSSLHQRAQRLGRQVWLVEHHIFDTGQFAGMITVTHDSSGSHVTGGDNT